MPFAAAVRICLNKYADFNGRARRTEFWWWVLFTVLLGIVASIIDTILGTRPSSSGTGLVEALVNLAVLLPTLAVGSRRLHDIGRSGWWQLLLFAIVVGWVFLIIWWCQDGSGDNSYGPSPKGAGAGAA